MSSFLISEHISQQEGKLSPLMCTHRCTVLGQRGTCGGAGLQSLIRRETHCLPSWSLHLERTLAQSHQKQITRLQNETDTYQSAVCLTTEGADMTEQCLTFRFPKSLGCFVYFLRVLISWPLCGFQHRKDNLKQQNKQRKPTVSKTKASPCYQG